ncbi:MAG: hypothetical protein ACRD3F_16585 [Acidobacteriaceae bacterium]
MRLRWLGFAVPVGLLALMYGPAPAFGVSCTTESQMTQAQRGMLEQAARSLGAQIQTGNIAGVKADTAASVVAHFEPLAATIERVGPEIKQATLTVEALYSLNATDLQAGSGNAEFFCAVPNSSLMVTITIPGLPAGNYALAILHATGVAHPQQITLILESQGTGSARWKLAGLYVRPRTVAGHDGVWYWRQARVYAQKKQHWNAYFYYQTAEFLLNPVDFLSSPNLQKLQKEMAAVKPADLPGKAPLTVQAGGQSLAVTALRTDTFQGGLDLVVDYQARGVSGPVETRTQIVELMKALLSKHPELREGFHGVWVYASSGTGAPFAIELPMDQIH